MPRKPKIAVIGAGMAGLTLAQHISPAAEVHVFDKSRGVGGRMSTRRSSNGQFDHGAPHFTASSPEFGAFIAAQVADGVVSEWTPRLVHLSPSACTAVRWDHPRYVAIPSMNSLCKAMAEDVTLSLASEICAVRSQGSQSWLTDKTGREHGPYDWIVCTTPAPQAMHILPDVFSGQSALGAVKMDGGFSLLIAPARPLALDWDAAEVAQSPISWIADTACKPARHGLQSFVCHASTEWAETHLEHDQQTVLTDLSSAFGELTGWQASPRDYVSLHRWRYANTSVPCVEPFIIDATRGLAACGDWCGEGTVQAAFESATACAAAIVTQLS